MKNGETWNSPHMYQRSARGIFGEKESGKNFGLKNGVSVSCKIYHPYQNRGKGEKRGGATWLLRQEDAIEV